MAERASKQNFLNEWTFHQFNKNFVLIKCMHEFSIAQPVNSIE